MSTPPTPTPEPLTRRELEARIIAKAWRDPAYKARLESDPRGVLEDELRQIDPAITLPDTLRVRLHEEDPSLFHVVLPRNPADISLGEVVGDNLEAVAPQTLAVVVQSTTVANVVGISILHSAVTTNSNAIANVIVAA